MSFPIPPGVKWLCFSDIVAPDVWMFECVFFLFLGFNCWCSLFARYVAITFPYSCLESFPRQIVQHLSGAPWGDQCSFWAWVCCDVGDYNHCLWCVSGSWGCLVLFSVTLGGSLWENGKACHLKTPSLQRELNSCAEFKGQSSEWCSSVPAPTPTANVFTFGLLPKPPSLK